MQGNGPLNRKKKVTGTASEDSMQTHGEGRQEGPVGNAQGYEDRKQQQAGGAQNQRGQANPLFNQARPQTQNQQPLNRPQSQPVNRPQAQSTPLNRPKTTTGQASSGSMNTHGTGMGGTRPQQSASPFTSRPAQQAQRPQQSTQQAQRPQQTAQQTQQAQRTSSTGTTRAFGGKSPLLLIAIVVIALLLFRGGGLGGLFGGGNQNSGSTSSGGQSSSSSLLGGLLDTMTDTGTTTSTSSSQGAGSLLGDLLGGGVTGSSSSSSLGGTSISSLLSGMMGGSTSSSSYSSSSGSSAASSSSLLESLLGGSWYGGTTGYTSSASSYGSGTHLPTTSYSGTLNRSVAAGSRNKYTAIKGSGKDTMTIMVYMCGADLESRSAMGTKDLQEMLAAKFGSKVKLIIFTGGATSWRNDVISSKVNQIWQVENGKLKCLSDNEGTASMTNPDTLASFIQLCAKNFKANRYALILWDHGSGSVSGYGYDEKNPRSGSMSLSGLNSAFEKGGVKFDFIGFDACLMATVENALMASNYADYLIASEETEPGIGWYYTDWLTALGNNTSISTLDLGKQICDDFVSKCATSCRGQQTTLSVIDLAELSHTVPSKLTDFSKSVTSLIINKEYKTVSNARNGSREFATSSRIDQVDLTDLCNNLNTKESNALAKVLREAVKYNRINNISNAYGLSIYFPYNKVSNVDKAVSNYAAIGMDESYAEAIRAFASVEASGQAVTGGTMSAMPSLFGSLGSLGGGSSSAASSEDMIGDLLSAFLGGGFGRIAGLDSGNTGFLSDRAMSDSDLTAYLTANILNQDALAFVKDGESWVMDLPAEQWALVTGVDQNVFYDNGKGYVDLGLDNLFEFDEKGRMVADMDGTWLALNGQPVPYYHETSQYLDDGGWIITGRVPALLDGYRVDLMIVFDSEHEDGYVAGARAAYTDETETVAKAMTEIEDGDVIQPLADLYTYDQSFQDSYEFGNPITVSGDLQVSNVYLPDASKASVTYRITDLYNQAYWTPVIGK